MKATELLKGEKISFKYYNFSVKGIGKLKTKKAVLSALELGIKVFRTLNKKGNSLEKLK